MKKTIITLLFSACISSSLFSQSFTIALTGGYCLPIASSFNSKSAIEFQNAGFPSFYTAQQNLAYTSYGQGGNIALSFDWFSKKNIGCGLKLNAMISSPYSYTAAVTYLNSNSANYSFTDKPFSFQFIPHISFKHDFKVVDPILEMGMLIGITNVKEDYQANYTSGDVVNSTINNHGNVLLGFYSSLGLAFKVSKTVRIMLTVNCSAGSYSPSQWDRTSFTVNGMDQMSYLSTSQKQGTFVKQLDLTAPQSSNQPHQQLKYSVPFSNVGINAGFSFLLGKKKDRVKDKEVKHLF
jgi:hypothetical protein